MLAFFGFLSIYFYVTKKHILTAISLTMLFYTKESGIVLGLVLLVDSVFVLFKKEVTFKEKLYNMLSLLVPVLLIGVFFLIQKQVSGWYVLPLYSNGLETSWDSYYEKIRSCSKVYFRDDVRRYFYAGVLALCVLVDVVNKQVRLSRVLLLAPFAFLLSSDSYHQVLPKPVLLICFALSFMWVVLTVFKTVGYNGALQKKYVWLTGVFILIFTAYTALNKFFIDRYMLIALVPLLFLSAILLSSLLGSVSPKLFIPALVIMLSIEAYGYKSNTGLADVKMGAFDGMYVQQEAMSYIEKQQWQNKHIAIYENLQWLRLQDFYTGFRKDSRSYNHVTWGIKDSTEVVMLENVESGRANDSSAKLKLDTNFILVHRAARGLAWSEVFERKSMLKN
jgi:hypothetical protein